MTAIEITAPGGPEVLRPCERPVPVAKAGEVLIRVEAAGVARPDVLQRKGMYAPPAGASDIPGLDVAGVTEDGQRVCAILAGGGYAEYVAAPVEQVLPIPEGWTFVEAASLPENVFTVFDNLVTRAGLQRGETVLIHGGTSGIGSMAVMVARLSGCTPMVTVGSAAKCAAALGLGAEAAINYNELDFAAEVKRLTEGRGVDVVLDMVGGSYFERNLEILALDGRLAIVATQGGSVSSIDLRVLLSKRARVTGSLMRPRTPQQKGLVRDRLLSEVWRHLPAKQFIRPLIDSTFPFREAARAHERMEEGGHVGKIVLTMT